MEIIKIMESKLARAALLVGLGSVILTGCVDYKGEDSQFVISGPVVDVGEKSVTILPQNVQDAQGEAIGWFESADETQVHDNYKNNWCNIKEVGREFSRNGQVQGLRDVQAGEWVELRGNIRDSKVVCGKTSTWETRPVYTELLEIPR